ncbi:MAG: PIN domain-containing protein, partial [Nanoarchaeota archaeon]
DSSVWLAYFFEGEHISLLESEEILFVSVLSLFEIKKKLLEKKIPGNIINEKISFVKKRSHIIIIDNKIVDKALEIFEKYKLPTVDCLIYASSISHKSLLITRDNDFRGLPDAAVYS